jgi:hypothetical protein
MSHPSHHCFIIFVGLIREEVMSHPKIEKKHVSHCTSRAFFPAALLLIVVFGLPPRFFCKKDLFNSQVPNTRSVKLKLVELDGSHQGNGDFCHHC